MTHKNNPAPTNTLTSLAALVSHQLPPASISDDQWPVLIPLALHHGLGPMLHWVLKNAGIDPDEDLRWEPLVSSAREAAINYALLKNTRSRVDAALREAAIPALWLKGIALAPTLYPQPWLRPMEDIDVLVHYHQREQALSVARSLGYQPPEFGYWLQVIDPPDPWQQHYCLKGGPNDALSLELHYRLLGHRAKKLLPLEQLAWFWDQASTPDEVGFRILSPEAHLLYLCAHALLQHGEAEMNLLHYFDLHLLATQTDLNWQVVVERALELRWSFAVERALSLSVRYFASPVPKAIFVRLREGRLNDEDISRVTRLQAEDYSQQKWKMLMAYLSPAERIRISFRKLFPPRSFLRYHYKVQPGQSVYPFYVQWWFDKGHRVARAMRSDFVRALRRP